MVTISLCMIVKDEERVLERCLSGVHPFVDEIIIVDTGSRDKTKEIAKSFTDKVFDFEWRDDFAAARNFSFSKATGDFVFWLDADDVILPENLSKLIALKEKLSEKDDVIMLKYETAFDENGKATFYFYRERIIRRSLSPLWVGRVHEVIYHQGKAVYYDISISHFSAKKKYGKRNLKIYEKQEKRGEGMLPRDLFYYGRELYYHKKYSKAERILGEFLKDGNGWEENEREALKILSALKREKGEIKEALLPLFKTLAYGIPRADVCFEIGNIFVLLENYQTAIFWFELARLSPLAEEKGAFIWEECQNYLPLLMLVFCYDKLGDRKKAEEYNNLAGEIRPNSEAVDYNKRYFENLKTL